MPTADCWCQGDRIAILSMTTLSGQKERNTLVFVYTNRWTGQVRVKQSYHLSLIRLSATEFNKQIYWRKENSISPRPSAQIPGTDEGDQHQKVASSMEGDFGLQGRESSLTKGLSRDAPWRTEVGKVMNKQNVLEGRTGRVKGKPG